MAVTVALVVPLGTSSSKLNRLETPPPPPFPQLSSLNEPIRFVASVPCSWLTGVAPDVVCCCSPST